MSTTPASADHRPFIAYCALHQSNPSTPRDEYVATMHEFHHRIHDESIRLVRERRNAVDDAQSREMYGLRNSLAEFLQTPLRADDEEIQKAMFSSFKQIRESSFSREFPGITRSVEGEVVAAAHGQSTGGKLTLNGRRYLSDLGFNSATVGRGIFESIFIIRGGENLDVLEHIVRDVLGIYATTHGKHITEFENYSYCLYNMVHEEVADNLNREEQVFEAALFFAKPGPETIKYAPFRNALVSLMKSLRTDLIVRSASLWQRKLGLGTGVEFVLRLDIPDAMAVDEIATWLTKYPGNEVVHRTLAVEGRLVLKNISLVRSMVSVHG